MNLLDTRQIWADTKLPQFQLQNHFWLTENHLQVQSRGTKKVQIRAEYCNKVTQVYLAMTLIFMFVILNEF